MKTRLLLALLLPLLTVPARAQVDCWIDAEHPQTADRLPVAAPAVAPLRQAIQQANALLQRQPELRQLPRSRLRSSWQIGGQWQQPMRPAHFLLREHREALWEGRCGLKKGADRVEPRASIVLSFNHPSAGFASAAPQLKDEQLQAWHAPQASGQLQGHTLWDRHLLVFSRDGRLPWVPLSTAEYLDARERALRAQQQEAQAAQQAAQKAAAPAEQEAMLQRMAEGLRRTNPDQAEQLIAEIRAQQAQAQAALAAAEDKRRRNPAIDADPLGTMLAKLRAFRASLTPSQLAAQAREGWDGLQPAGFDEQRFPLLVKLDPNWPWDTRRPAAPQLLMLSLRGNGEFEAPMQRVLQGLDLAAWQALVQGR